MYFLETLVRLHRAGEGEPYTGLRPAGLDAGPAITKTEKAIASGRADEVVVLVRDTFADGLRDRLERVLAAKTFDRDDIAAGRAYVEAYVDLLHYVESSHAAVAAGANAHHH